MRLPSKHELYKEMFSLLEEIEDSCVISDSIEAKIDRMAAELDMLLGLHSAPPLIYIAGQYFPSTKEFGENAGIQHWKMHMNIEKARIAGAECVMRGWMPIIPHTNTAWMSGLQAHKWWYESTNEQLRVCDAILMVEGWEESHGAQMEHDEAVRMGIKVYFDSNHIPDANWKAL